MKLRAVASGNLCHAELHRNLPHDNLGFGCGPLLVIFEELPNGDYRRMRVAPRPAGRNYRIVRASREEMKELRAHGFHLEVEK